MTPSAADGARHPLDELLPYLLGELDPVARAAVDAHLERCASCRTALAEIDAAWVASVEALPPVAPSEATWDAIAGRVAAAAAPSAARAPGTDRARVPTVAGAARGRGWAAGGMVASLALAAAFGLWGFGQRQAVLAVRADLAAAHAAAAAREGDLLRRLDAFEASVATLAADLEGVARWLSEAGVAVSAIAGEDAAVGAVLYRSDGTALVVMREAPAPGRSLQAWGVAAGGVTSLGAFEGRVWEVSAAGFDAVAISLEPLGGSPAPTEVLGAAPRS